MATAKKASRSNKTDHFLDDAKNVIAAAKKQLKAFALADKGKKIVRVNLGLLKSLEANIEAFANALGESVAGKVTKAGATAAEVKARIPVYETLIDIRDDVATTHRGDKAVAKAFGMGTKIDRNSTPRLLKVAADLMAVIKNDKTMAKAASDAGIHAPRIAQLKKAHDALNKAQETQISAIASARPKALDPRALQRIITADTTFIRKVAAVVFRKDPKALAEFKSMRPRVPAKKKKVASTTASTAKA